MAGALRRDAQPTLARELDDRDDVVAALRQRDRDRVLVGREVPRGALLVPIGVAGDRDMPGDPAMQAARVVVDPVADQ